MTKFVKDTDLSLALARMREWIDYGNVPKLKEEVEQNALFTYRAVNKTGLGDGYSLPRIIGNTLAWNQQITNPNFDGTTGWASSGSTSAPLTVSNNVATVTKEAVASGANSTYMRAACTVITGHKYYISVTVKSNNTDTQIAVYWYGGSDGSESSFSYAYRDGWTWLHGISTVTKDNTQLRIYGRTSNSGEVNFSAKQVIVVDLTKMYGSGNEPTAAQFEALFTKPWYPKNDGELISNNAQSIETEGRNLWDEEWEKGTISGTGAESDSDVVIRSKNFSPCFPSTEYYFKEPSNQYLVVFWYDGDKKIISYNASIDSTGLATSPANARFVRLRCGSSTYPCTTNPGIWFNLSDASFNGTYEHHKRSVLNLNLKSIKVKSPNIWDEEALLIGINQTTGLTDNTVTSVVSSKNYIKVDAGGTYYFKVPSTVSSFRYFYYDADYNYLGTNTLTTNATFTVPSGVYYMRFQVAKSSYGELYNNDICINKSDAAFNGRYFPAGILTLTGGLKSAGTYRDEIIGNKYYKRVNRVHLKDETWNVTTARFYCTSLAGAKKTTGITSVCSKYLSANNISGSTMAMDDKTLTMMSTASSADRIYVRDDSYEYSGTGLTSFVAALEGVYLDYALATEEVYELADGIPSVGQMDCGGTMRILSDNNPISPFYGDISFGLNTGKVANDLSKSVPFSRSISVGTGLNGGGDLSADRTIALSTDTLLLLSKADSAYQKPHLGIPKTDLASNCAITIGSTTVAPGDTITNLAGLGTISASGALTLTTNKKIYFGDTSHYLELTSDGFHFSHGLYSDGFISAGGLNSGGGGLNVSGVHVYRTLTGTAAVTTSPYCHSKWDVTDSTINAYEDGMLVCVKVPVAGNGSYGTALQINSLGYKPIVFNVNSMISTRYSVGSVVWMVYNSTQTASLYIDSASAETVTGCWQVMDYDSTNIYQFKHNYGTKAVVGGSLYRYMLCFSDGENILPFNYVNNSVATNKAMSTQEFSPTSEILYYSSTSIIAEGSSAALSDMYIQTPLDLRRSMNTGTTLTANEPVYIVCQRQSNGKFKFKSTTPWSQTLPATNDGYYYIYLGLAYDTYRIELSYRHPIYYNDGVNIVEYNASRDIDALQAKPQIKIVKYEEIDGSQINHAFLEASHPLMGKTGAQFIVMRYCTLKAKRQSTEGREKWRAKRKKWTMWKEHTFSSTITIDDLRDYVATLIYDPFEHDHCTDYADLTSRARQLYFNHNLAMNMPLGIALRIPNPAYQNEVARRAAAGTPYTNDKAIMSQVTGKVEQPYIYSTVTEFVAVLQWKQDSHSNFNSLNFGVIR